MQRLPQRHNTRRPSGVQDIEVQRHPDFKVGLLKQRLHQNVWIDITRARLKNQPDVFRALVVHISKDRHLAFSDERRNPLHKAALLNRVRNFRHDDLVLTAPQVFLVPRRAQLEPAPPGFIGINDVLARLNNHSAGRKIGTGD